MANIKDHVSVIREGQDLLPGGEGQDFWPPHAPTHQDGGSDKISVNNLLGTLADPQNAGWIQGIAVPAPPTTPNDGDTLVYNQGTGEWVYGPPIPGASIWARDNGAGFLYPITSTDELRVGDGNAGTPAYAFLSAGDSGFFWDGHPALSLAGLRVWQFEHLSNVLTVTSNYRTRIIAQHDGAVASSAAVAELVALSSSSGNNAQATMYAEHTSGWGRVDIHAISGGLSSATVDIWANAESSGEDTNSYVTLGGQASGAGLRYLRLGGSVGESPMLFDSIRFGTRSLDSAPAWTQNYLEFCQPGNTTQWTEYRTNFGEISLIQALNLAFTTSGGGVTRSGSTVDNTIARWNGADADSIQGSGVSIADNNDVSGVRLLDFNTSPGAVTHTEGRLFYDSAAHTLALYSDITNVALQLGQEAYVRVHNATGSEIPNGTAVYFDNGSISGIPTVAPAFATAVSTARTVGIATHAIANGSQGFVTVFGDVTLDTTSWSEGDTLYLSDTTAGAITNTLPTGGNIVFEIGTVTYQNANGKIYVRPHGLPLASDKSLRAPGDFYVSANGSTLAAPRVIGATDMTSGEGVRYQFGDAGNGWQNGYDQAMQMWAYHSIILMGNRSSGTPPSMVTTSDVGVLILATSISSPTSVIRAASGQTGNLLQFQNSSETVLTSFEASGHMNARTISFNQWPTVTSSGGAVTVDFSSYQKVTVDLDNDSTVTITLNTPNGPGNYMIELLQGGSTATTTLNFATQGTYPLDIPSGGLSINEGTGERTALGVYFTGSRWGVVGTPMEQLLAS